MSDNTKNIDAAAAATTETVKLEDVKDYFHYEYEGSAKGLLTLIEKYPQFAAEIKEEYFWRKEFTAAGSSTSTWPDTE